MDVIGNILNGPMEFFAQNLAAIKFVSFLISSGLIALIVYFLLNTDTVSGPIDHFVDVFKLKDSGYTRASRAWKRIQGQLKSGDKKQWRLAVVEADAVFDETLRMTGHNGKNFDDRLEAADHARFFNITIEEIKQAHRLRDRILFEPDFSVSLNEAEVIVRMYRDACKELNLT